MRIPAPLAATCLAVLASAPVLAAPPQSTSIGPPDSHTARDPLPPDPPPYLVDGPVCEAPSVWDPQIDRIVYTGSDLPGTTSVSFDGTVYTLRYDGDETIEYRIDLSDSSVAAGFLRIYEATSDAYPVAGGGPAFRDASGALRDTFWLSQHTALVSSTHDATSVTLEYEDHVDGVHRRKHRFEILGKSLRIRVWDTLGNTSYPANYAGAGLGHTEGTDDPHVVRMQGTLATPIALYENGADHFYCANQLDLLWSNAADWHLPEGEDIVPGATSVDYSYSTAGLYYALTDGTIAAPLDETFNVIVSSRIEDVLVTSTTPVSPYRDPMTHRMVVMFTGKNTPWSDYLEELQLFERWGLRNLAGYFFAWWSSTDNGDATHFPAKDEAEYIALRHSPEARRILLGEYTKYWKNWGGSPWFSIWGIPLNSFFQPKDTNLTEGARVFFASNESKQLKAHYGSNLGYQDVLTYASPSRGIGTDSITQHHESPWAKTNRDACIDRKRWLKSMQDILDGPLLGEASIATQNSNMEWLWMGYCDSVQRTINTGSNMVSTDLPDGDPLAPTLWPVIPEYEWRVIAGRQVNHGNAFYMRFFSWADLDLFPSGAIPEFPIPEAALDRYRTYEVTYGHSSFVQTNGPFNGIGDYMPYSDIIKEYYLMNGLQQRFFASPVRSIDYRYLGAYRSFDEIMELTESTDTFVDPRIRIELKSGLTILVNHHPNDWVISTPGIDFTIPEDGFYAYQPGTDFIAFSGIPTGAAGRFDYALVPGEYEFFDGRGVVAGHGGITTTNSRLQVDNVPLNRTIWEDDLGKILTLSGPPPTLQGIEVTLVDDVLGLGHRTSVRVTGTYANGGKVDLTTEVQLQSADPKVATVTPGGVVEARCVGKTQIRADVHVGITPVSAVVTVVP